MSGGSEGIMLYYLHLLEGVFSPLRIFRFITFRTVCGAATAFAICIISGPFIIRWLRKLKIGQYERKNEAPPLFDLHGHKEGTPTMGGALIVLSAAVSTLLWGIPANPFVLMAVGTMLFMALVGFWDDYAKVRGKGTKGISARCKALTQLAWTAVIMWALHEIPETREYARALLVPFFKNPVVQDMGVIFGFLFIAMVMLGATNGVNLTDGLDGLAIGCTVSVAFAYLIMAYAAGHIEIASYLMVPYVPGSGELAVFCGAVLGACMGFLWYNCHPASVFMGDTGSLALGGAVAIVAILIKQELVLLIVGGVFVMEALSVIIQVVSFKLRRKRVFAMAPLHHHFEMKGWSETQATVRFWILSAVFAILGLATLKIR